MYYRDISLRTNVAAADDMLGESIDPQNGGLSFSQTDIDLPGSGPPVRIIRTLDVQSQPRTYWPHYQKFADWQLFIPRIKTLKTQNGEWWPVSHPAPNHYARCSMYDGGGSYFWGMQLEVPGFGSQEILVRSPENTIAPTMSLNGVALTFPLVTNRGWAISCLPNGVKNRGIPGEAFLAVAPDGTKYWFDWMTFDFVGTWRGFTLPPVSAMWLNEASLFVTKVEDRFGNQVIYRYEANDYEIESDRLVEISASDGRKVSLQWTGDLGHTEHDTRPRHYINKIITQPGTAAAREWTYTYERGVYAPMPWTLRTIARPDGSSWRFDLDSIFTMCEQYPTHCSPLSQSTGMTTPYGAEGTALAPASVRTPSGLTATYNFERRVVGRHGTPESTATGNVGRYATPKLMKKRYFGAGIDHAWTYSYVTQNPYNVPVTVAQMRVKNPDGTLNVSFVDNHAGHATEGIVLQEDAYAADQVTLVRRQVNTYETVPGPFPAVFGEAMSFIRKMGKERIWPLRTQTITQDGGTTFTRTVNEFDVHARPTLETKSSSLGNSKTERTAYFDHLSKWVLGQVASITCTAPTSCAGKMPSSTTYDPTTALPLQTKAFNKLQRTMTHNADGTLATVSDGRDSSSFDTTIRLSSWKRGIPQQIQFPATDDQPVVYQKASVNDNGWIDWVTDENRYQTCYHYDDMGRLERIEYPELLDPTPAAPAIAAPCDVNGSKWAPTTSTFDTGPTAVYGLPAGHWRQRVTTGTGVTLTYFDALWRPVVKQTYDQNNTAGTLSQTITRYDASGRPTFLSYPQRSQVAAITDTWADPAETPVAKGVRTEYDALDRVTATRADSEKGLLSTTTEYRPGFITRVTQPEHQGTAIFTETSYATWDEPTTAYPTSIDHPLGVHTSITRDAFGKPTAITRSGAGGQTETRTYVYHPDYQTLCKIIEPETGVTAMDFDGAGNLQWSASGLTLSSPSSCNSTEAQASGRVVDRLYDQRNRLKELSFPDLRGDQSWTYKADGKPWQVETTNVPGTQATVNTYDYDTRRNLTTETVLQGTWFSFSLGYLYDANGSLTNLVYPSTENVSFAPNALGQPTKVASDAKNYASNVQYYPNGAIDTFTYGNGVLHKMVQNDRQLPLRVSDDHGVLAFEYWYDKNGNTTHMHDQTAGTPYRDRLLYYDELDRLTDAGSAAFGGDHWHRFSYNALDNLKSWILPGVKDYANYYYDPVSNRLTNIQNTAGASIVGMAYDVQGNLSNKGGTLYDFDFGNRLRQASYSTTTDERYRYDAYGRRVLASRLLGPTGTTGVVFSQYSNSGQLLYQDDQRLGKKIDHLYLSGSLIAQREVPAAGGAATIKYLHTDALGSPIAVTNDSTTVTVLERSAYEPYGKLLSGPVKNGPGYTGHALDVATGMNYMQQRYYDPQIGRFLSVDPIAAEGKTGTNFNRYWYANNNPYKFTDPDGRLPIVVPVMIGASACARNAGCRTAAMRAIRWGGAILMGGLGAREGIRQANEAAETEEGTGNTNPYEGPVETPVVVVDSAGNAIPVGEGEQIQGSPDGNYQQVKDETGKPTGVRLDRGGHRNHADPKAQGPHGHRPGVTDETGNQHLPIQPPPPPEEPELE